MIQCSEKCFHENDGLCTLNEVTPPSSTPIKDCPYFTDKDKKSTLNNVITPSPIH
ncbi:hydroxymyristoyl-ACP dehydratase [Tissierella creatinini]|nr:hydroxymyristoyl-ACP dehydratase [Tissierella creatinini]TJX62932.1 hydroxymyristoyl-ACP dehydratase [Soehngenia saccharolytica]